MENTEPHPPLNMAQTQSEPLENKLRSMILTHADAPAAMPQTDPLLSSAQAQMPSQQDQPPNKKSPGQSKQEPSLVKPTKKRPNQAQRRQMSAQLAITFDPRPPLPHTARPYMSPVSNSGPFHSTTSTNTSLSSPSQRNQHLHHTHRSTRPQSAPFRSTGFPHHADQPRFVSSSTRAKLLKSHPFPVHDSHQPHITSTYDSSSSRALRNPNASHCNHRGGFAHGHNYSRSDGHQGRPPMPSLDVIEREQSFLNFLSNKVSSNAEIERSDIAEKEIFRLHIEKLCQDAIARHEAECFPGGKFHPDSVQLKCFGSLSSGFATKASDMDLGILSPMSQMQPDEPGSPIPRLLEKAFLDAGLGARLISRTRVPIIKVCEKPTMKLRQDLLHEREKWDSGISGNSNEADDELHEENHESAEEHGGKDGALVDMLHGPESPTDLEPEEYNRRLKMLSQKPNQALSNYNIVSKKLLRKLGGHEIRHSNVSSLQPRDISVLADVCRQYIHGLIDPILRHRLLAHPVNSSLFFDPPQIDHIVRSLASIHHQTEGEKLVMAWETRTFKERDHMMEEHALQIINAWNDLQNRSCASLEPLSYTKDLERALGELRKIPSLQMKVFEQSQHETATDYHQRAVTLLSELGGTDSTTSSWDLSSFVDYYIAGIRNPQLRLAVEEFSQELPVKLLAPVALRHKSLQLALDYERAIEKELYNKEHAEILREYIEILRGPINVTRAEDSVQYGITMTKETQEIIRAAQTLTDPTTMACNQARDQYRDKLEFPSSGIGVQCDINFSAHLALQNTLLLRCYSHTDPRVRPIVLFVKHWAKMRNINQAYRGSLNSYGYVLMVLHYLVNIADPFICPNLQQLAPSVDPNISASDHEQTVQCKGRNVRFWRDEEEIKRLASQGHLNMNTESIGSLLAGFFEYFTEKSLRNGKHRGFDWGRDVLSLRTHGGLLTKYQKGWTGAYTQKIDNANQNFGTSHSHIVGSSPPENELQGSGMTPELPMGSTNLQSSVATVITSPELSHLPQGQKKASRVESKIKEVKHRYLFAIEDPFELDHNVARTVTHNGIVAIRDEFRRAWRIIQEAGRGVYREDLLQDAKAKIKEKKYQQFRELLAEIHGEKISHKIETEEVCRSKSVSRAAENALYVPSHSAGSSVSMALSEPLPPPSMK